MQEAVGAELRRPGLGAPVPPANPCAPPAPAVAGAGVSSMGTPESRPVPVCRRPSAPSCGLLVDWAKEAALTLSLPEVPNELPVLPGTAGFVLVWCTPWPAPCASPALSWSP
ncbi:hypothetical protein GCM10029964_035790 [Kibdelosporangium lantanae]